jgi:diguanylate cyclase (GGDEF)-like protein
MTPLVGKRLSFRLIVLVGLSLLTFSLIATAFTYHYAYRHQLELAGQLQKQLVQTIQIQAEVAAFAANRHIAVGVIEGLLANPIVLAVRIESAEGFKAELGSRLNVDFNTSRDYPLYSPVDHIEVIGSLTVIQNDAHVHQAAMQTAAFQTKWMLAQVLTAAIILAAVLRFMLVLPITRLAEAMAAIKPGSSLRLPIMRRHLNDEIGMLSMSANAMLDAAENAITEVTKQRNELERLATHDHLTGLPTMRLAEDRLQIACSRARRSNAKVALLFIDLDGFKSINDNYSHEAGDEVLKEVSKRLLDSVRANDTAARIGGDEFMVILENITDIQASTLVASNIIKALTEPIPITGRDVTLSASIGIAIFPDHTEDVKAMRHLADHAMYRVKQAGKGSFALIDPQLLG